MELINKAVFFRRFFEQHLFTIIITIYSTALKIQNISSKEFYELLIKIKGIGPWSIEMSRIFYVGDPDIFSLLDLGLKNAHLRIFNINNYNESFYKEFSPYRSYMCLFMWRVLEDDNVTN